MSALPVPAAIPALQVPLDGAPNEHAAAGVAASLRPAACIEPAQANAKLGLVPSLAANKDCSHERDASCQQQQQPALGSWAPMDGLIPTTETTGPQGQLMESEYWPPAESVTQPQQHQSNCLADNPKQRETQVGSNVPS